MKKGNRFSVFHEHLPDVMVDEAIIVTNICMVTLQFKSASVHIIS